MGLLWGVVLRSRTVHLVLAFLVAGGVVGLLTWSNLRLLRVNSELRSELASLRRLVSDQQAQIRRLQEAVREAQVSSQLLVPAERSPLPVTVKLDLPGLTRNPVPVEVRLDSPGVTDRQVLVARTRPVYCETKEECDRIYARAQRTIDVKAEVPKGTVVPVELDGSVVRRPLAEAFPVELHLVEAKPGAYVAVQVRTQALEVTEVTTRSVVPDGEPPAPARPPQEHFGPYIQAGYPSGLVAGLEYQRELRSGLLRAQVGWSIGPQPGPVASLTYVFRLR